MPVYRSIKIQISILLPTYENCPGEKDFFSSNSNSYVDDAQFFINSIEVV